MNILLVEDEISLSNAVKKILEQQGYIGFIVDAVNEVVTLNTDTIEKVEANKDDAFVQGVGKTDDGLISILNLNALIDEQI